MEGYEKYFPEEFLDGFVRTAEIVDDFIDLKLYEEEQRALGCEDICEDITACSIVALPEDIVLE